MLKKYIKAHEEHAISPLTISPNHNAWATKILIDLLGGIKTGEKTFCVHEDWGLSYYADPEAWDAGATFVLEKIKNDKDFIKLIIEKNEFFAKEVAQFINEFLYRDLSNLANKELAEIFKKSYQLANDFSAYGYIPVLSDHYYNKFTSFLKSLIDSYQIPVNLNITKQELFNLLTTPTRKIPSQIAREELAGLLHHNVTEEQLREHYKKWYWLTFGHLGPEQTFEYFSSEIKELLNSEELMNSEQSFIDYEKDIQNQQIEYEKLLSFSEADKYYFFVAQTFTYLKGLRMELLFGIYALWSKMLDVLSKRFFVPKKFLYYCSISELVSWLLADKEIPGEILQERSRFCVWVAETENEQSILIGQNALEYLKEHAEEEKEINKDVFVVHGTIACSGRVSGKVKIINKISEIKKIEEGDILLSVATNPALLPAMKKAIAFVTDTGGINSHAAIVAREMKKPCIIGTKMATKIFKDGDMIEVDAMKGEIRKI